uniref:Uncharacterized protein n=1 Tax=Anguilla anguilla TaxID=7936 RepID=A0A0E9RUZ5_ANGAN
MSEEHKPIVKIRGVALGKSLCELAALPATDKTRGTSNGRRAHPQTRHTCLGCPWMPLLWSSDKRSE